MEPKLHLSDENSLFQNEELFLSVLRPAKKTQISHSGGTYRGEKGLDVNHLGTIVCLPSSI